jgi:acylphosphatase
MRKHFNIKITGEVQGVFFRASAKKKADALNISGFVRNEPDGSVYVETEGEEENIRQFIQWCQHGPPHARVDECKVTEGAVTGFSRFLIER